MSNPIVGRAWLALEASGCWEAGAGTTESPELYPHSEGTPNFADRFLGCRHVPVGGHWLQSPSEGIPEGQGEWLRFMQVGIEHMHGLFPQGQGQVSFPEPAWLNEHHLPFLPLSPHMQNSLHHPGLSSESPGQG